MIRSNQTNSLTSMLNTDEEQKQYLTGPGSGLRTSFVNTGGINPVLPPKSSSHHTIADLN